MENQIKVLEFYSYPTSVSDVVARYKENADHPRGDEGIKQFFEDCLEVAEKKLGRHLRDNKIAMKVQFGPLKTTFFLGYKDCAWSVGKSLNPYMTGKMTPIDEDL